MIFAVSAHDFFGCVDKENGRKADRERCFCCNLLFLQRNRPLSKHHCHGAEALRPRSGASRFSDALNIGGV